MRQNPIISAALACLCLSSPPVLAATVAVSTAAVLAENPSEAALALERAALAARMSDRKTALALLASAEQLKPSPIIQRGIALLYQEVDELPRARANIQALLKVTPKDARLHVDLASIEARAADKTNALKALTAARALTPDANERQRMLRLYRHLKSYADAKSLLDGLIQEFPSETAHSIDRATLAVELGETLEALAFLAKTRKLKPDRAAKHRMAILHQQLKDYPGALSLLEPLAKEKPEAAILGDLGVCKHLAGRTDEAITDLVAAIKLDAKHLPPYFTLASIYAGRKEFDKEFAVYESAPVSEVDPELKELLLKSRQEAAAHATPPVK